MKKRKLINPKTGNKISCYMAKDVDNLLQKLKKLSRQPLSKFTCAPSAVSRMRDICELLSRRN